MGIIFWMGLEWAIFSGWNLGGQYFVREIWMSNIFWVRDISRVGFGLAIFCGWEIFLGRAIFCTNGIIGWIIFSGWNSGVRVY